MLIDKNRTNSYIRYWLKLFEKESICILKTKETKSKRTLLLKIYVYNLFHEIYAKCLWVFLVRWTNKNVRQWLYHTVKTVLDVELFSPTSLLSDSKYST